MAILIVSAGWVLYSGFERSKEANHAVEHTYRVLISSESFLSTMRETESSLRAYLLAQDTRYLARYQTALAKQAQILTDMESLTRDNPRQESEIRKIRELATKRLAVLAEAARQTNKGKTFPAAGAISLGEGPQRMDELTAQVREFEAEEHRLLVLRNSAASDAEGWTRLLLILTSALLALILLFGGVAVQRYVNNRERLTEALRESEDRLRVALETGRIGIFNDLVSEGRIVYDERARQILGLGDQTEVNADEFFTRLHPDDRERILNSRSRDLSEGADDAEELNHRIIHPNGDVRWIVIRKRVYAESEGATRRTRRVLGVLLDITEQKRAEQKLKEALEESDRERRRLGAILDTMPAGVVLVDRENQIVMANMQAARLWQLDSLDALKTQLEELKGWNADTGQTLTIADWPRTRALGGETIPGEIVDIERFDGSRGTVFAGASPVRDAAGVIQGAVGVMVDITEQRQVELALRRSEESLEKLLEQKTILFQEVQHRVKNNLQIVSSLLSLEAQRFKDSAFHNALNESRDRIRSMALMHEKFYHLDDLARIDFSAYVDELARYFFSSYIADPTAIVFAADVDVQLSMGAAIPCGLILQELLSNTVKHAFPDGRGEIRIDFHSQNGESKLRYWDNGVGLPETVDLENPGTLGLQLVTDLAAQLHGKLRYQYSDGAEFTLSFAG